VRTPVAQILIFLGIASIARAVNPSDLSGKWELLINKSTFGSMPKPARMTVESTVKGNVMHAVQTTYLHQDNQVEEFTWYLDGKRHETAKPVPGYSVTRWEGDTLVNERQSNDGQYKETIRVALSNDGKTATEDIQAKTPIGNNHAKLIWQKQGQ
jgi:hypothetical protein